MLIKTNYVKEVLHSQLIQVQNGIEIWWGLLTKITQWSLLHVYETVSLQLMQNKFSLYIVGPCFFRIMMSMYTLLSIRKKWDSSDQVTFFSLICGLLIFSLIIDLMMDIGWHRYSDPWSCCFRHSKDQSDFSFLKPLLVIIYYNWMSTLYNLCCF